MANRRLTAGNPLFRRHKNQPGKLPEQYAICRDVITHPRVDGTEYVAALCEGVGQLQGKWIIWRTYFTENRHGKLAFGQYGPQAPIEVDQWIADQIQARGWYGRITS